MNRRDDRREGNRHCKERASKDKVLSSMNSLASVKEDTGEDVCLNTGVP